MLGGKSVIQPEAMIRGDLVRSQSSSTPANNTAVAMGRYCFLSRGALLRPPGRLFKGYRHMHTHKYRRMDLTPEREGEGDLG